MDEITIVRRRLNREKWFQIINECRSSEMPVNKWCKANGVCEQTYYKWLKKFREETLENSRMWNSKYENYNIAKISKYNQ